MARFVARYPHVALSLTFTDQWVGLIDGGYDLAIRTGRLDDSAMMSRKLGESERARVAGGSYASARPHPARPSELEEWDWIGYRQRGDSVRFTTSDGEAVSVTGHSQLEADSIDAVLHFACQKLGATILPLHLAGRGETSGELVRLLTELLAR